MQPACVRARYLARAALSRTASSSLSFSSGAPPSGGTGGEEGGVRRTLRGERVEDDGTGDAYGPVTSNLRNLAGFVADGPRPAPVLDRGTPMAGRAPPGAAPRGTPSLRIVGPVHLRALLGQVQSDPDHASAPRRHALAFLEGEDGGRAMANSIAASRGEDVDPLGPPPTLTSEEREAYQEAFAEAVELACDYVHYPERNDISVEKLLEEKGLGDYEVPGKPTIRLAERPEWRPLLVDPPTPERTPRTKKE